MYFCGHYPLSTASVALLLKVRAGVHILGLKMNVGSTGRGGDEDGKKSRIGSEKLEYTG